MKDIKTQRLKLELELEFGEEESFPVVVRLLFLK